MPISQAARNTLITAMDRYERNQLLLAKLKEAKAQAQIIEAKVVIPLELFQELLELAGLERIKQ